MGDEEADYAIPIWAGVLPLRDVALAPVRDERLGEGIDTDPIPKANKEYVTYGLFYRFCQEDWDNALGFVLVFLIRRKCFYSDIPETFSLD